jgi:hypothetical protein
LLLLLLLFLNVHLNCFISDAYFFTFLCSAFVRLSFYQGAYVTLTGVSSDATRMKFTADGRFLVVLDAKTRAVLQFAVVDPPSGHGAGAGAAGASPRLLLK